MNYARLGRTLLKVGGFAIGGIMGLATAIELPDDIRTIKRYFRQLKYGRELEDC